MIRVTKEIAHRVWSYLEAGDDIETVCSALQNIEERTIERLRTVMNGFKEGKSNKELATPEWKENTIAQRREWWEDYLRSKYEWSRHQHLDNLAELAKKLRNRIINPEIRRKPYEDRAIWYWGGQDWRFAPVIWLKLVAPFLEAGDFWSINFENLMSHLSDSLFVKHYDQLKDKAIELQRDYNQAAEQLRQPDIAWYLEWQRIQNELGNYATSNYVPDAIPEPGKVANLPYSRDYCERTIEKFAKLIPDLDNKFKEMENQLQLLWDDLDPDIINLKIEQGKCERCSSSGR